jgi:hypothetical protein
VAAGDLEATPASYADPRREWLGFWGPSHIRNSAIAEGVIRLAKPKLKNDLIEPADLVTVPHDVRSKPAELPGARADRIGITATAPRAGPVVPRGRSKPSG